jgi:signal transduction histidine kinase
VIRKLVPLLALLSISLTARTVKVGFNDNPPQMYRSAAGVPSGFVVDVINEAARRSGIEINWIYLEKGASFEIFRNGVIDVWPAGVATVERSRVLHLTSPWWRTDAVALTRQPLAAVSDLDGMRVAAPSDLQASARKALPRANLLEGSSPSDMAASLCRSEVDAIITDRLMLDRFLLSRPIPCTGVRLTVLGLPGASTELSIIARREAAGSAETIRQGIAQLETNGRLVEIGLRYAVMSGASAGFISALTQTKLHNESLRLSLILVSSGLAISAFLIYWLARAVRKRRLAETELRQINADLEQFNWAVHHDLAEPLRNMAIFSELLQREYPRGLNTQGSLYLGLIYDGAARMIRLLDSLRAYSDLWHDPEPAIECNTRAAVEAARQNLARSVESTGARITADPLPPVFFHQKHLVQLFQNLFSNAIQYKSAAAPRIHVGCTRTGGELTFSVQDNGIGISVDHFERIFRVFKRLHGPEVPGTGIGLALCRRIVERHGGRIWVESEPGVGSRFLFTIPGRARRYPGSEPQKPAP